MDHRLTAILYADVAGYSRLTGMDEEGTHQKLSEGLTLLTSRVVENGGRVIHEAGDAILAEFNSTITAVQCAADFQRTMAVQNTDLEDEEILAFRVGINLGEVIDDRDDIYGDGVNIAARLEGLAETGGICISGAVYDQVQGKIDLGYEYLGEQSVKNIAKPVQAYKVLLDPADAGNYPVVTQTSGRKSRWFLAAGLALIVAVSGSYAWMASQPEFTPANMDQMILALPDKPSIAVLPFDNMSDDPEQGYFADGMTEDLITDISKVAGLFVISRNATFTYKGKPVKPSQVAEELGVRYVLEGSVRRSGDVVRVNAQLIDAVTGFHVWAEKYDEPLSDVFELQDKIVAQIAAALKVSLANVGTDNAGESETDVAQAYDAFLMGWELYRRDTRDDTVKAISFFELALELDPDYVRPYAALAATYWRISDLSWARDVGLVWQEVHNKAKDYLAKALTKPSSLAYSTSSRLLAFQGRSEDALAEIERAIALDRNNPDHYISKSWILIFAGRPKEAEENARLAMRINPLYPPTYLHALGRALFYKEQYLEAAKIFERVVSRQPKRREAYMRLAATYGHLGRFEEAKAAVSKYNEITAERDYTSLTVQEVGLWYEDTYNFQDYSYPQPMFEGLRKAGVPEGAAPAGEGFNFKALVSKHIDKNSKYYNVKGITKIDAATAKSLSDRGVTIIDVRDAGNFARGHIPSAINMDLNLDLTEENLANAVKKTEEVVFHCWGVSCQYSAMACAKAVLWGYTRVYYFDGGFPAWKAAGFDIATD